MKPEIPPELKAIVDRAAGKEHSAEGAVMACVTELLTAHEQMVRTKVADEIEARIPPKIYGKLELAAAAGQRLAAKIARGEG
jgi:hypothetical protein